MTTIPTEDVEPDQAFTSIQKVLRYYPQRVQVLAMAGLNLMMVIVEQAGLELDVILVGSLNSFVLAVLVFFYGEQKTASKQAVADWLDAVGRDGGQAGP